MKAIIKTLGVLTWICTIIGCTYIFGSVDAFERDMISTGRFWIQEFFAFALCGIAYLIHKVREYLIDVEYDKYINDTYNR